MVWVWTHTPEFPNGASLSVSVSDWSLPAGLNWRTAWYTVILYGSGWSPIRNCNLWRAVPWLITTAAWEHELNCVSTKWLLNQSYAPTTTKIHQYVCTISQYDKLKLKTPLDPSYLISIHHRTCMVVYYKNEHIPDISWS